MYLKFNLQKILCANSVGLPQPPIVCVNLISTCLILADTDKMYVLQVLLKNEFQNTHCENR